MVDVVRGNLTDLAGYCVRLANLVTPIASPDWDDGELGQDDGSTDGCGDFLGALHSKTDVAIVVTNSYKSLQRKKICAYKKSE